MKGGIHIMSSFKKVLITGISGSGGSYLADYIMDQHPDAELHGISRWRTTASSALRVQKAILHECDLNDFSAVLRVLKTVKPDVIFHLASHANVRVSFDTPLAVLQNNIMGTANLLEAIRAVGLGFDPMIMIISSSEVYGQVDPRYVPIKEDCPMNPSSPYAVSKVAQDLLGFTYFRSYGMSIIRIRAFAYLNPRRNDLFATSFAMQVARIEAGLQKELLHGNLDSVRTIIDVRDAMEAYWIAAEKCQLGEAYNVGGNTSLTVGEFLEILKCQASCNIPSRVDPKLLRPADVTLQIPDTSKFVKETGWQPRYSFSESVSHLLDHCRSEVWQQHIVH